MKDLTDIDKLVKETRRYEFMDGLVDFTYGILFLVLGLLCWFVFSAAGMRLYLTALLKNREITILGSVLLFSLFFLLVFGSQRIVQRIRRARIWAKSGFVKPLRSQVSWPVQLIAAAVAIALILTTFGLMLKGLLTQDDVLRWLVFATSLATGITFLGLGLDIRLRRYICVGVWGIGLSTIILTLQLPFSTSWLYFGISWMVVLGFSGGWALWKYQTAARRSSHE